MLEANYLSILLKPNYEKAIDTAQDVLDRGLSLIAIPERESLVELLRNSPYKITRELAERTIVAKVINILFQETNDFFFYVKDYGHLDELVEDACLSGSSVFEVSFLYEYELAYGKWYRSKDRKGGRIPFASYMLNKKWTREEEFNNHLLRFQQVEVSSIYFIKLNSDILGWIVGL